MTISIGACSNGSSDSDIDSAKDLDSVLVAKGREDALKVGQYNSGSPERETELIRLRTAEQRLRSAGMENSADSYLAGVKTVLDSLGIN